MIRTQKIKGLMREAGETQEDLAKLLGKSRAALNYNLSHSTFTVKELGIIAQHYNVSIKELVE